MRAFFLNDEMVGGYSINTGPRFFHIDMIPVRKLSEDRFLNQNKPTFTEVRSLWIKSRAPNHLRAEIYCRSVIDAAATRPDYILGGTFTEKYRKTQMRALPKLLYHGEVEVWDKTQVWWIFYGKPIECILRLPFAVIGGWLDRRFRVQDRSTS